MKLALITDAWRPQVNGVVTTLVELHAGLVERGHEVLLIEPGAFRRFAMPGYREIKLAWRPYKQVAQMLDAAQPEAVHIATEGPLGTAARKHCLKRGWRFTTAFHTRFPEILAAALRVPERWGYGWFKRFHAPSSGIMVPSAGMQEILAGYGFAPLRPWSHGVDLQLFQPTPGADLGLPRPVFLYVGRLSPEKNLEAFLDLELPGSKVVYGVGPLEARLKREYPQVHWRGVVPRSELSRIYSAGDVFVFPGRSETFGLVMLEALACGTPVAAYPVAGPLDVLAPRHDGEDGGVLHAELRTAALQALDVPRRLARRRAEHMGWDRVCSEFVAHLVEVQDAADDSRVTVTKPSQNLHKLT
jgi:glycosyltransferase involved in cell wall biosynthesis